MVFKNTSLRSSDNEYESATRKKQNMLNNLKQQLEWVKRQLEYVAFTETYEPNLDLRRGDIFEFDWGVNVHCEFSNRHYGVVLADSRSQNPLVVVCPLKTNRFGANPSSDVNLGVIEALSSERETLAVVNQIRSLDKMRIYIKPIINSEMSAQDTGFKLSNEQLKLLINGFKRLILGE